jgi:hypothetical protein
LVTTVLALQPRDPEEIIELLSTSPKTIANALYGAGQRELARPFGRLAYPRQRTRYPREEILAEVLALAGESPVEVCRLLGKTPGAISQALYRCGRSDLASPFEKLRKRP